MASFKYFFAVQMALVMLLLNLPSTVAVTECTDSCWRDAVATCTTNLGRQCVCNSLETYRAFQMCDQECKDCGEWDGLSPVQLCDGFFKILPSKAAPDTLLHARGPTTTLTEVLDEAAVTPPTTIGWCGVPGSPCFDASAAAANVDRRDHDSDVSAVAPTAQSKLATFSVPTSSSLTKATPTHVFEGQRIQRNVVSHPRPGMVVTGDPDHTCDEASGMPCGKSPVLSTMPNHGNAAVADVGTVAAVLILLYAGMML